MTKPQVVNLPHCPNSPWDDEQKVLVAEYHSRVESIFDRLPNNGAFYFSHAAAVLRKLANDLDPPNHNRRHDDDN